MSGSDLYPDWEELVLNESADVLILALPEESTLQGRKSSSN